MNTIRPALVLIALFTVTLGFAFPVCLSTVAGLALPYQSGGSLIESHDKPIGSALIGQNFTSDKYFQGRPSALTGTDPKDPSKTVPTPYDASESGASNLGPTSQALLDRIKGDVGKFGSTPVPADAVTASASGLDPDISPETAARQVARIAAARRVDPGLVRDVLAAHTQGRLLGVIGEPRVNVLQTNLALDATPSTSVIGPQAAK